MKRIGPSNASEFTLPAQLEKVAARYAAGVAIGAPGRPPLRYEELWRLVREGGEKLRERGVHRTTRIGLALSPGPENATAFLVAAAHAVCVPFNPDTPPGEWAQLFQAAGVELLFVDRKACPAAVSAAAALGIPRLLVSRDETGPAGRIDLESCPALETAIDPAGDPANEHDIALLIRTSGSTGQPRWVPLHHGSLVRTALATAELLELGPADRCLHMLAFFHVHGLVSAVLCPLVSGGAVLTTGLFDVERFPDWMNELRPTWYSAVPTIHRAILEKVDELPSSERPAFQSLRFIRSGAAPMDDTLRTRLQTVLGVALVEAYGTSEAPQVSCNPVRAPRMGSVGVSVAPEIRIADSAGQPLATGETGEICLRGDTVFRGYDGAADEEGFRNGWFRTGDLGRLDADGYLYFVGRLKELINRGGQKVFPIEVDTVLCGHPAVSQAIAFAVPHRTLGEDLAAAVVLKDGQGATEQQLREFAAERLPGFKTPSRIVLVDDLPKGPTGKPQRIGLFDFLRDRLATEYAAPIGDDEHAIAAAFAAALGVERIGREDNFFYLGGDSLKGQRTVLKLADQFGVEIPPGALFRFPTVATLTEELQRVRTRETALTELADELRDLSPVEREELLAEE